MNILSHFSINLNDQQESVIRKVESFLSTDTHRVFLLKGYAGTGKTTLVKGIIDALDDDKKKFVVCAPTGRASKVLREKTGYGKTIHSTIYDFENLVTINAEEKDSSKHSFKYLFPVVKLEEDTIIIVDEASMISSRYSKNELFDFGTNILLDDLLTYAQLQIPGNKNKIIFIGDPAQLAPVRDNNSWALEKSFFEAKQISVSEVFLTMVMRQNDNLILKNATKIRSCIENPSKRRLEFEFDNNSFIDFTSGNIVQKYCELFPVPDFDSGVIINFSNAQNLHYNNEIREIYFPGKRKICVGDLVQIICNNYHKYGREIFNGEFAKIVEVGSSVQQSVPFFVDEAGKSVKKVFSFTFREVKMVMNDGLEPFDAYINETLLESTTRDLTVDEMKALYVNTVIRFRESYPEANIGSEEFKKFLKNDDFFNALRVKYGYAITGHKSQGGEWKKVFVDYYGRVSLQKDPLRWCYTATTRASEQLYAVNYPNFGKYHKLNLSTIGIITKTPADSLDFSRVPVSPHHNANQHKCKSLLYWNVFEKCEDTPLLIEDIVSFDYLEKYTFSYEGRAVQAETFHNGAGYFHPFKFTCGSADDCENMKRIVSKPDPVMFSTSYVPSEDFLQELYVMVQAACNDLDIRITNAIEKKESYFVNYFFETDAEYAQIQFYFNGKNEITRAMVKSTSGDNDPKLKELTSKILEYATVPGN